MKKTILWFIAVIFLPMNAWATPTLFFSQTYYKIKGDSAESLRNQLNALGPFSKDKRYDASTTWYVTWQYNWRYDNPSQNPCYITDVKVSANIVSTLPEWEDKGLSAPDLQMKWDAYLNYLRVHEKGHEDNAKEAANEIEKTLQSIPSTSNCTILKSTVQDKAQAIIKKHNTWDDDFDASTEHGKNQGAVFP